VHKTVRENAALFNSNASRGRISTVWVRTTGIQAQERDCTLLDPYGMQVDWTTLEAIASTNAVDLWYLFPLGVAVNRLLAKDGEVPDSWKRSLNRTFGTDTWYGDFCRTRVDVGLFDSAEVTKKVANFDAISDYFVKRLGEIFKGGVAKNPLWLKNSTGCPLYLLCFATANPNAPAAIKRVSSSKVGGKDVHFGVS